MSHVRRWGTAALALVALMFVVSSAALAQSDTATISGSVRDPSGAAVPNASATIRNQAIGIERKVG